MKEGVVAREGRMSVCQCVSVRPCSYTGRDAGCCWRSSLSNLVNCFQRPPVFVSWSLDFPTSSPTRQCHHATGRHAATVCTPPTCTASPNATPWPRGKSRMSSCSRTMRRQSNGHTALYKSVVVCGIRSITLTRLTC